VYHYRDNTGLEVDAIVEGVDGRWCAFEIKLGGTRIDEVAANLLDFRNRIDLTKCGEPGVLAVIVGKGYGYEKRRDCSTGAHTTYKATSIPATIPGLRCLF
jgi:uncharacterized protein